MSGLSRDSRNQDNGRVMMIDELSSVIDGGKIKSVDGVKLFLTHRREELEDPVIYTYGNAPRKRVCLNRKCLKEHETFSDMEGFCSQDCLFQFHLDSLGGQV